MSWLILGTAILLEVGGTLSLRQSDGMQKRAWTSATIATYVVSTYLLWLTLDRGMAVGVAYGIWAATGVALTALAGRVLFKDPLTPVMLLGIVAIAGGVLLIELGAH
ncbi:MAG: cation/cationic drug transporter [Marmoricola sp.]|nr:cation/cationic drug transporter [Marmoricola sp.]